METKKELDLRELLPVLVRKSWLIALVAVIAGVAMYIYTAAFVMPMYKSSITIYVNNTTSTTQDDLHGWTSSDLMTSQKLVRTYVELLKSDKVLNKVAEEVGEDITAAQIRSMISTVEDEDIVLFQVDISNADPELAYKIANAIADVAPDEIAEVAKGTSAAVVDYANQVPTTPYTPNHTRNALLGAVVGALLVIIVIVLQVLLDNHINTEEDLRKLSDAPVLGVIPDYNLEYKKGGYESDKSTRDEMMGKGVQKP